MKWFELLEQNDIDFGSYLFGEFKAYYNKIIEKDTPYESDIFKLIFDFIGGSFDRVEKPKVLIDALKTLLSQKNKYPEILKPKDKGILYRGTSISKSEFEKLSFVDDKKIKMIHGNEIVTSNTYYIYKSRNEIQSWSTDINTSFSFRGLKSSGEINIVLACDIPESEILFSSKFLNIINKKVFGSSAGLGEDEIIRVSKKPLKCNLFVYKKLLNQKQAIDYILKNK